MKRILNIIEQDVERSIRFLLSAQDRSYYSATKGCFDRRFWEWKIVDFPESTFQRNVLPVAWLFSNYKDKEGSFNEILFSSIKYGLLFASEIQHKNGSFDQAFPNENSFGATAFLIYPLLKSYNFIYDYCTKEYCERIERSISRAAYFICKHNETHGQIANHRAGAALSLFECANFFHEERYEKRALDLLDEVIKSQSEEGWFPEYEGADPGYQTLSLYYLAHIYRLRPNNDLRKALEKAISFLSWFVHPDGTFGGEYGSRRTAVYYPGGMALLSNEFPMAWSITKKMLNSIAARDTVALSDIDMGNIAPLISNYIDVIDSLHEKSIRETAELPCEREETFADFPHAGIFIRCNMKYYSIVGVSNGGVLKIFNRKKRAIIFDDCGYIGKTSRGTYITTQITDLERYCRFDRSVIEFQTNFYEMMNTRPTPLNFLILRFLNLTVMRSIRFGNWMKYLLVGALINRKRMVPVCLARAIYFEKNKITIRDMINISGKIKLTSLEIGRKFTGIHMASANYFERYEKTPINSQFESIDIDVLQRDKEVISEVVI